jgi:DNA-binding MarR family transcriptional regulator
VISMSLPINLTKSTLIVLDKLAKDGPMCPQEIATESGLAMRTVTLALKTLQSGNFCRKVPNLMDMRKPLYHADYEKIMELQRSHDIWRSLINLRVTR